MTRKNLEEMGLTEEQIEAIMKENGKDIENVKAKFSDYEGIKSELAKANETIESFKDYDNVKADVEKYKGEIAKLQEESKKQIEKLEREQKIKDFTSGKKFVNDFTRDSINSAIYNEIVKEESKGKSVEDLFNAIIKDKENILLDEKKPEAPKTIPMSDNPDNKNAEANRIRSIMGVPLKND